jgi:hypothetical protein
VRTRIAIGDGADSLNGGDSAKSGRRLMRHAKAETTDWRATRIAGGGIDHSSRFRKTDWPRMGFLFAMQKEHVSVWSGRRIQRA